MFSLQLVCFVRSIPFFELKDNFIDCRTLNHRVSISF